MKKIGISIGLVSILLLFFIKVEVLTIHENGQVALVEKISGGDYFEISQIHSLSKTWIKDGYVYKNDGLFHSLSVFEEEGGAGMPQVNSKDHRLTYNSEVGFEIQRNTLMSMPMYFFVGERETWILYTKAGDYHPNGIDLKLEINSISLGRYFILLIRCKYAI